LYKIFLIILTILFSSCSLLKTVTRKEKMKIASVPSQALVYNNKNELIGKTPLEISPDELEKYQTGNFVYLTFKSEGYLDLQVVTNINQLTSTEVKLEKMSSDHFEKWVFNNYKNEINYYSKDLLSVQWLIFTQKYPEARNRVFELNKKYPNIAAVFTMMAQIELQEKKFEQAKVYIEKALQLDEKDITAIRMLALVNAYLKENG
jgi:predicted Zn-dependent protease